jgi:hypothetical protein
VGRLPTILMARQQGADSTKQPQGRKEVAAVTCGKHQTVNPVAPSVSLLESVLVTAANTGHSPSPCQSAVKPGANKGAASSCKGATASSVVQAWRRLHNGSSQHCQLPDRCQVTALGLVAGTHSRAHWQQHNNRLWDVPGRPQDKQSPAVAVVAHATACSSSRSSSNNSSSCPERDSGAL